MVDGGSNTPNYYNLYGKKNHLIPTNYDVLYATPSPDGRSFALEVFGGITLGSAIWQIGLSGNFMGIIQDEGAHSQIDGKPFVTDYEGHTVYEGNPIWSPDGKKILYQTFVYYNGRRRDYHLWQLDLEKGNQVLIDRGFTPNISRNGKRIVYSKVISESNGRLNWDIWEYSLEPKKRVKRLTTSRAKEQYPSWAYIHGKEYILYSAKQSGYYDIWKMEKDGTNPTPITFIGAEQKTDALGAMASPDGKKIVFWSVETGPGGIEMNEKIWI
ncbi:MAG: hypothetical protein GWN01_02385, partial [Nitrosopumilaceae archaeon]|nr:hypothetical protein [Nitrosopumilaceae archaeon]NIU86173.1 hypothetical protein [Nitrosopumilaceae archaeon]NIX60420.1 hypothetical protein [Nitrosopumilaceae archaeon]